MGTIAKWFYAGMTTAAESDAIARCEGETVGSFDGDITHHPQGPPDLSIFSALKGIGDLHGQVRFDVGSLTAKFVGKGTGGAIFDHFYGTSLLHGVA